MSRRKREGNTPPCPSCGHRQSDQSRQTTDSQRETGDGRSWLSAVSSSLSPHSRGGLALRIGLVGASGSGKTSLLRQILKTLGTGCRILLYDPYGKIPGRYTDSVRDFLRSAQCPWGTTATTDPELYKKILSIAGSRGHAVAIIDESQDIYPHSGPDPGAKAALLKGRNRGLGMLWVTCRPTECDPSLLGVSQGVIAGTLLGPTDQGYVRGYGIKDILPMYHFKAVLPNGSYDIISQKF